MQGESLSSSSTPPWSTTVLALFLGICPFLGVSAKKETAWNMGLATTVRDAGQLGVGLWHQLAAHRTRPDVPCA